MFGELLRGMATVPAGNLTGKMSKENCEREQGKHKKNSGKAEKRTWKSRGQHSIHMDGKGTKMGEAGPTKMRCTQQ